MGLIRTEEALKLLHAAGLTSINEANLRYRLRTEQIKATAPPNGSRRSGWRIDEDSLLAFIERMKSTETNDKAETPQDMKQGKSVDARDLEEVLMTESTRLGITYPDVTESVRKVLDAINDVDGLAHLCVELLLVSELRKLVRASGDEQLPSEYAERSTPELLTTIQQFQGKSGDVLAFNQIREVLRSRGIPIELADI